MALPNGPYNSALEEQEILKYWLEKQFYKPEYNPETNSVESFDEMKKDCRETWTLICPPPNAYGRPHIGNISGYAYMDAMARFQRMQGKKVLVLPGKDHAGLEGEGVFVREILEKKGINKFDLKREEFYQMMMDFNLENMKKALKDEQEIGLSADFDRNTFTLDEDIVKIVLDTFVEMYQKGMIYKGVRIVNWDPKARTAVADNQTDYIEAKTPFFYFKYAFPNPEQKALELRKEFEGKGTLWKVTENDEAKSYLLGERHNGVKILGIAYDKVPKGIELDGKVIGIQMRLDGDFRLVVRGNDFDGNIDDEIEKVTKELFSEVAGSHIIKFEDYKEDKFYTNGFVIGTVRPETVFADTAIACDPKDERYKDFVGKAVEVEILGEKKTLNFISDFSVDNDFGTGLLKITPAHSVEDWEIANRHAKECLPAIQVIGYDLRLNHLTGKYEGKKAKEVREEMKIDLKNSGNLVSIDENYENKIKIAERTKAPIEPLLSSQWYLKYDGIKEAVQKMVNGDDGGVGENDNSRIRIYPENMVQKFNHWMDNLRDWAISRSLWWGYRLPVWYAGEVEERIDEKGMVREFIRLKNKNTKTQNNKNDEDDVETNDHSSDWIALEYNNPNHLRVQKESPGEGWHQDENVLDTWFSSGQWVYATLTKYNLMDKFFPTDVMVSGHDILENWISRMMMFTYFKHQNIPFKNVYLTGLVKGTDGQKMSKSKGNMIDIDKVRADYGTDAVRLAYFYQNSAGASYAMTYDKLKNFKQFCNKIWNAGRFVLMNTEGIQLPTSLFQNPKLSLSKEIIAHTKDVKEKVTKYIENYDFGYATEMLYQEFWHTFCDKFIEESKQYVLPKWNKETKEIESEPNAEEKAEMTAVMLYTLKEYLKMLHPFIPFITERIWKEVPKEEKDHEALMYTRW